MILLGLGATALIILILCFVLEFRNFDKLFNLCNELLETVWKLSKENLNLALKNEKLKQLNEMKESEKKEKKSEKEDVKDLREQPLFKEKKTRHGKMHKIKNEVIEMYVSGFSFKQIAERFGVDQSNVRKSLIKWGVYKTQHPRKKSV